MFTRRAFLQALTAITSATIAGSALGRSVFSSPAPTLPPIPEYCLWNTPAEEFPPTDDAPIFRARERYSYGITDWRCVTGENALTPTSDAGLIAERSASSL